MVVAVVAVTDVAMVVVSTVAAYAMALDTVNNQDFGPNQIQRLNCSFGAI